jgi:hypothetical protein
MPDTGILTAGYEYRGRRIQPSAVYHSSTEAASAPPAGSPSHHFHGFRRGRRTSIFGGRTVSAFPYPVAPETITTAELFAREEAAARKARELSGNPRDNPGLPGCAALIRRSAVQMFSTPAILRRGDPLRHPLQPHGYLAPADPPGDHLNRSPGCLPVPVTSSVVSVPPEPPAPFAPLPPWSAAFAPAHPLPASIRSCPEPVFRVADAPRSSSAAFPHSRVCRGWRPGASRTWGGLGLPRFAAAIRARRAGSLSFRRARWRKSSPVSPAMCSCNNRCVPGVIGPTPMAFRHFVTV